VFLIYFLPSDRIFVLKLCRVESSSQFIIKRHFERHKTNRVTDARARRKLNRLLIPLRRQYIAEVP
jgi:hypothetical protein